MTTRVLRTAAMHGVRYPELVTKTSSRGVPGGRSPGQIPHVSGPDGMLGPLRAAQPEPGERVFATDEVPAIWSGDAVQRPPRLLLTLLGDYWWRRTEPLPSAALVALLAEFAVSDSAARAARILDDGGRQIFSFGRTSRPWDGMWSLVAFSIPERNRAARDSLRKQLRWLGFAPLYDGLWVAPRDRTAEVITQLAELGITTATAFRASTITGASPEGLPQRAWDLDGLRVRYDRFIASAGSLRERALAGQVSPVAALIARTRMMDEWRGFPELDPDLPDELLPGAWPRATARELFTTTYDLLGPLAAHRIRQIIARYSPELAVHATHHSSELKMAADASDELVGSLPMVKSV